MRYALALDDGVASTYRPALQDRARIVFDCRMTDGFRFLNAEQFGTILA